MRIETSYQLKCVAIGLCCLALSACGGVSAPGVPAAGAPQAPAFSGAGLPAPSELGARAASGTYVIDPAAPLSWTLGETPADPFTMVAPASAYRFAIYECWPANAVSLPQQFVFNLEGSAGIVWLGLANYTADRWEWQAIEAPFSSWMEIPIPSDAQYYSATEMLHFALVACNGDTLCFAGANLNTQSHWLVDPASWQTHTIAEGANFGRHHSACLLDSGVPAIVYTKDDTEKICFAYATSEVPGAPADWVSHVADGAADLGGSVDICLSSGVPAIVYEDTNRADVYYAYSAVELPTAEADWVSHKPDANAQANPRLAHQSGLDFILYRGISELKIAHALFFNPAADTDWEFATVDSGASGYDFLQLEMHPSGPVAAYKRLEGGQTKLYYAWSDALDGGNLLDFNTVMVDDTNTNSGNNVQLVLGPDSQAWIAYTNVDIVHYMRFAYANIETPSLSTHFTRMDVFGQEQTHTGQFMGLGVVLDRPLFSFIETGSGGIDGIHAIYPNRELEQLSGPQSFDLSLLYDPAPSELVNEETEVLILSNGWPAVIFRSNAGLQFSYFPEAAAP